MTVTGLIRRGGQEPRSGTVLEYDFTKDPDANVIEIGMSTSHTLWFPLLYGPDKRSTAIDGRFHYFLRYLYFSFQVAVGGSVAAMVYYA